MFQQSAWKWSSESSEKFVSVDDVKSQAPVVQKVDNTIHWINHYPVYYV